ncbi:coiled-coil domain-containing protein 172-like isoform X3 [Argopecten irradians]|uniref:coiled-coil domain-containing protein 172-like isoform X3 n=1 Tax=Argopecten irradians TaxID=31199 RepID=UPI00371E981F
MSSSLTDLFAQIIDSERRAHERKTYLQEVRNKVRQKEADILQLKQEKEVLRKELEVKIAELNKVDVNLILVNNRKEILTNQKSQLQKERQDFEDQLENLEEELFHVNERFCSDVETFVTEYGLLGNGADIRRDEALRQIEGLSAEKNQLHQEIRDYEERMESLRILRDKETDLMDLLQITKAKNSELCEKVAEEKRKLLQQEEEKQSIQLLPTTDADFIRLQTELDSVKEEDLEAKCHHLQQQVQSLQQQLWQRKNEDLKVSTSNRMCVSSFTATTGANQTQNEAVDELKVDNLEDIFDDDLNLNLPQQNDTKPVKKQHIFRKGSLEISSI